MKATLIFLLVLLVCCSVTAQQITLTGQVSIHNSKYNSGKIEYVKDAYASAPNTKPDDTDDNGIFHLEFVGIDGGASVKVLVEKAGLELVCKFRSI